MISTYGFTEAKMAWCECLFPVDAEPSGYHLYPDLGIVEIVDPETGALKDDGEPGEIVFTSLDARGSCVLRYRTGDIVEGGVTYEPCPHCGRVMPRLVGRISRRSDVREMQLDKIKGTLVDFNELEHVLDDMPRVGSWQIELRKANDDPLEVDELVLHISLADGRRGELGCRRRSRDASSSVPNCIRIASSFIPIPRCAGFKESGKSSRSKRWSIGDSRPKGIRPAWRTLRRNEGEPVLVIAGVRTPFAKAGTSSGRVWERRIWRAPRCSACMVRTALDPARIDEVILGCVAQPADALNLARVAALRSGIPKHVPALTVQRNCASGIEAITQAWLRIQSGEGELYLVGGVESMSSIPLLFPKAGNEEVRVARRRQRACCPRPAPSPPLRPRDFVPTPALRLGLSDPVSGLNMGETAEVLAREFGSDATRRMPLRCGRTSERPRRRPSLRRRSLQHTTRRAALRSCATTVCARNQTLEALGEAAARFRKGNRHGHGGKFLADYRWCSGVADRDGGRRE